MFIVVLKNRMTYTAVGKVLEALRYRLPAKYESLVHPLHVHR